MKNVLFSLIAVGSMTTSFAQNPYAYNKASLQQSGDYQQAYITQTGAYNQAGVTQENKDEIGGNYIEIAQVGGGSTSSDNHRITAKQTGSNGAVLNQVGASTQIDLLQVGFGNQFESNQTGTSKTFVAASVKQTGINNEAYLTQTNTANYSQGDIVVVTQTGEDNQARLKQEGIANETYLIQQGNGNVIQGLGGAGTSALQSGIGNRLNITQTQYYNTASVGQTGNNNVGVITQAAQ
ncbi:hypothetical protein [Spirosoma aerophilum]